MPKTGEDPVSRFNREIVVALGFPEGVKARKVTIIADYERVPVILLELIEYEAPALDKIRDAVGRLVVDSPTTVSAK